MTLLFGMFIYMFVIRSATSVDVEEGLYKKAQALGISVVTISQVCCALRWITIVPSLKTCIMFLHCTRSQATSPCESFSNCTYLPFFSIVQRPALIPYHAMELRLIDGEGGWELRSIQGSISH